MPTSRRKLFDLLVSEVLVLIAPVVGGVGFYLTANVSWGGLPLIVVSLVFFGLACMGPERLREWAKRA